MSQITTSSNADALSGVPHMRVLVCRTCRSVDEMPDWEGRVEDDPYLPNVVAHHGASHEGQLFRLPIGLWLNEESKKSIIEQIRGGGKGMAAFDPEFYNTRNTFMEDAQQCFSKHQRPKGGCSDWRHDSKELTPKTKADRKEAGMSLTPTGPKVYLCDFCPVRMHVENKINEKRGL